MEWIYEDHFWVVSLGLKKILPQTYICLNSQLVLDSWNVRDCIYSYFLHAALKGELQLMVLKVNPKVITF